MGLVEDAVKAATGRTPEGLREYLLVVAKRTGVAMLGTGIATVGIVMLISGNKDVKAAVGTVTSAATKGVVK